MLFQYAQLTQDSIRVVEFHPSSSPSDVHLTLSHQNRYFDGSARYTAIWDPAGNPDAERKTITLNGRTRSVASETWDALSAILKYHGRDDKYWIHAVCVNQQDETEKRTHAQQLGRIFSSAAKVYIWLGLSDEAVEKAFSGIQRGVELDSREASAVKSFARRAAFIEAVQKPELRVETAVLLSGGVSCPMGLFKGYLDRLEPASQSTSVTGRPNHGSL